MSTARLLLPPKTLAAGDTPDDLIYAVNELRASYGLEPYRVDPWLMAYAQEHSEYQAEIHSGTHLHRDGVLPWEIGIQENVAGGSEGLVTAAVVVYQIWVDWGHRHILTGYTSGEIGAGVAHGDDGLVYYTVDIRPTVGAPTIVPEQGSPAPFSPYVTSTPDAAGAIYHIVGPSQSLWSIAISYGVTVDAIRQLNGIPTDSVVIQVGQKLLIRPASAVTASTSQTPMETATRVTDPPRMIATKTSRPTSRPTSRVIPTVSSTTVPTSTPAAASPPVKTVVGAVGLVVALVGFIIVMYFGFIRGGEGHS